MKNWLFTGYIFRNIGTYRSMADLHLQESIINNYNRVMHVRHDNIC